MTADVLIVGGKGQLGRALAAAFAARGWDPVHTWDRPQFDIADPGAAAQVAALTPAVVVNAAAWTDVDGAEGGPEVADRVYAINALGPRYLAEGCAACGAFLIQVSTNEVFPGLPAGKAERRFVTENRPRSPSWSPSCAARSPPRSTPRR